MRRPWSLPSRLAPPKAVVAAAIVGALLAVTGPFGSYLNEGPARRGGYWIGAMLLGLVLYGVATRAVAAILPAGTRWRWPALLLAALVASLPQAIATRAAAWWLWPVLGEIGPSWPLWYAQTATVGVACVAAAALLADRARPAAIVGQAPTLEVPAAVRLGADVLALQMEDHYVRVHRAAGSELVLMPLGRAIDTVDAAGLRTHRSWWVAADAVERVEGDARSMRLHLANGVVAPVARSAVAQLRAAGWLSGAAAARRG